MSIDMFIILWNLIFIKIYNPNIFYFTHNKRFSFYANLYRNVQTIFLKYNYILYCRLIFLSLEYFQFSEN